MAFLLQSLKPQLEKLMLTHVQKAILRANFIILQLRLICVQEMVAILCQ